MLSYPLVCKQCATQVVPTDISPIGDSPFCPVSTLVNCTELELNDT